MSHSISEEMPSVERALKAIEAVRSSLESADRVSEDGVLVVVEDRAALRTVLDFATAAALARSA